MPRYADFLTQWKEAMPNISSFADYFNAIRIASDRSWKAFPMMAFSVLYARFRYNIGPRYHSLFKLNTIPSKYWHEYLLDHRTNPQVRRINQEFHSLARNKIDFAEHCVKNDLPAIPIVCILGKAFASTRSTFRIVESVDEWTLALINAPSQLFIKFVDGAHGNGAFVARRRDGKWCFENKTGSLTDLYSFCMERLGGRKGWIIQPVIYPHPSLSAIMPDGALGTIRAITYLHENQPHILPPIFRIPAGGNITDNFSESASGNLVAPIDVKTGEIGPARISRSRSWPDIVTVKTHPDTGSLIAGLRIPFWDDVCKLVLRGQAITPQLRTIGWDIAITMNGPLIVEANTGYDVNLLQVAYNRGIKADLEPILAIV